MTVTVAVVDASVALKWVLNEAGSNWSRGLATGEISLVAPLLLWTECANGLWRIARASPPGALDASAAFDVIAAMPVRIVEADLPLQATALHLSLQLAHPVYDCLYLALALSQGAALATADTRFLRVIARAGILPPDRLLTPPA